MTDPTRDPSDDLADVLAPPPATGPSPQLRAAVLYRTERVLARARLARLLRRIGVIVLVFAAGWWAKPTPPPGPRFVPAAWVHTGAPPQVVTVPVVVPVLVESPSVPTPPPSPVRSEPATAAQAELLAEQADVQAEAARLYHLAGDKYLNDEQDYRNAARCYRLFIARAGDTGMSPEPTDTWLLTSIKNAAFKERFDGTKTDG